MNIFIQIIIVIVLSQSSFGFQHHPHQRNINLKLAAFTELLPLSISGVEAPNPYLIELAKALGQLALPVAVGTYIINNVQVQVKEQIAAIEKQITANKELIDKQLTANKEQITASKELIDKQLKANKEQIAANKELIDKQLTANKELNKESIKASELRIENILMGFVRAQEKNNNRPPV